MAKNVKKQQKQRKSGGNETLKNLLPQNILPVGERVEENKNIYISQPVYKQIHSFTKNKTTNESGGMLIGSVIEEFGKTNIIISGFVEAKYCEATPTTLTFTHETWDYVHREIEKKHKGKKIVGWIHTHPDFGIFLSEYDKFIHQNFFSEAHQVAYVVDPIQQIEGFYFWINSGIEKCKGFYIYDKTGAKINLDLGSDEPVKKGASGFGFRDFVTALLAVAVAFLFFSNVSTSKRLKELENQREIFNMNDYNLHQMVIAQNSQMQQLTEALEAAGIVVEEEDQEAAEEETPQEEEGSKPENE